MVGGYKVVTTNKIPSSWSGISSVLRTAFVLRRHSALSQPSTKGTDKPYQPTPSESPNCRFQLMLWESCGMPAGRTGDVTCQRHILSLVFPRDKTGKTHTSSKLSYKYNVCICTQTYVKTQKSGSTAVTSLEIWFGLWRSRIINWNSLFDTSL